MTLRSNEKRAKRRQECREALAAHIRERLGISVAPGRVRLQPCADDGYAWSVTKDSEHLLKTSLSNGSIGVYDSILRGLYHLIEAVTPRTLEPDRQKQVFNSQEEISELANGSFTATIQRLERENQKLTEELKHAICYSEELLSKDQNWMNRTYDLEEELNNSKNLVMQLQEELQGTRNGIEKAMKVLRQCQSIRNEAHIWLEKGSED